MITVRQEKPRLHRVILHGRWGAPLRSPSSSAEKCERGAVTKCQLGLLSVTRRHERSPVCPFHPFQQVALFTMRIHCKVVVIAVCFGVFLLLYFLGGNAADDPLLKEVIQEEEEEDSNSSPSSSELRRNVAAKFARKPPAGVAVRPEEPPLKRRKEGKPINRGASVNAKRWGEFVSVAAVDFCSSLFPPLCLSLSTPVSICAHNNSIVNYLVLLILTFSYHLGVKECVSVLITLWSRRAIKKQNITSLHCAQGRWLHNSLICQGTLQHANGHLLGCIWCPLFVSRCWIGWITVLQSGGCSNIWLKCE